MVPLLRLDSGWLTIRQSPHGEPRARGLYFGPGGFTGWDDGVTMRSETAPRPQAHGDFDSPGYLAGRLVPMKGVCIADSPSDLETWRDLFIGHGSDGSKFPVAVERNGRTLHGTARQAAGTNPTFVDNGTGRRAEWATTWWFPDPLKYGTAISSPRAATVTVINEGNFPALPRLRVAGSAPSGYVINGPDGRQILVSRALVPGQSHVFDMADAALYVGGTAVVGGVTRADLFTLPPLLPVTVSVNDGLVVEVIAKNTYV